MKLARHNQIIEMITRNGTVKNPELMEKFGVKITFQKGASFPCDRTGEYFWICIEGDFPYILDEERDLPITFSQKLQKSNIISKIKSIFCKPISSSSNVYN